MKIVENKINDDVILSNHKLNDEEIINAYSKLVKQIKKQLAIYKRALELACEDISLYEDITTPEFKARCYLDQAKKEKELEEQKC